MGVRRTHRALASTRVHLFPREGPHGPGVRVWPSRGVARLSLHKIQNLFRSIHRRSLVYTTSKVTRGMGYERCSQVRAPLAWNLLRQRIFSFSEFFFYESFPSPKFVSRSIKIFCWRIGLDIWI